MEAVTGDQQRALWRRTAVKLADLEGNPGLSSDTRFDLIYDAAHSLALYALRQHGYRPEAAHRHVVFDLLDLTAGLDRSTRLVLTDAHQKRNASEYRGELVPSEALLRDMLEATLALKGKLKAPT